MCRAILLIALLSACSATQGVRVRTPAVAEIAPLDDAGELERSPGQDPYDARLVPAADAPARDRALFGDRREALGRASAAEVRLNVGAGEQGPQVGEQTTTPSPDPLPSDRAELDRASRAGLLEADDWSRLMPRIQAACGGGIHLDERPRAKFVLTSSEGNVPVAHADSIGTASCASAEYARITREELAGAQSALCQPASGSVDNTAGCSTSCAGHLCRVCCTRQGMTLCH